MHEDKEASPLFEASITLLKSKGADEVPRFGGIASSESKDQDGDVILRKMLDISYLEKRGYVNWNHSKEIEDQLGFTTNVKLIQADEVSQYEDLLQTPLDKSASLYVEGTLYKNSPKAMQVYEILKSIPVGAQGSLGLSVEGGVLRSETGVVRAMVRGVAITPTPAHPDTLCRLMKSLSLDVSSSVEGVVSEKLAKSGMTESEAVIRVMELRPNFPLNLAKRIVRHVFNKLSGG